MDGWMCTNWLVWSFTHIFYFHVFFYLFSLTYAFVLFVLQPCMGRYCYASLSVSAGWMDHRVKNKLRSGGIHQTMSFHLWRFLLSDMRMSFHSMSLQDPAVYTKDWDLATELTLLLYFFAHFRSLPTARSFVSLLPLSCQFPIVFPYSEAAVITSLKTRVYSQIPSLL